MKKSNFAFADKVNMQDKSPNHHRKITEREFIFDDSDSDDHNGMTTPRKFRPKQGYSTPIALDLAKADCGDKGKLRN